jgi:hypothetical protein
LTALEEQLATLEELGLVLGEGVTVHDLTAIVPRGALEAEPYRGVIEVMGYDMEREPFTPLCDRLWMCDYECIEGPGSYREILERLERLTACGMAMQDIQDHVDFDAGEAFVQFTSRGTRFQWDVKFDGDWIDPLLLAAYAVRLRESGSLLQLYSNHTDYGQVALLGAFTPDDKARFDELTSIEMPLMEEQI